MADENTASNSAANAASMTSNSRAMTALRDYVDGQNENRVSLYETVTASLHSEMQVIKEIAETHVNALRTEMLQRILVLQGEIPVFDSDWTIETLKELIEKNLVERDRAIKELSEAGERALQITKTDFDRQLGQTSATLRDHMESGDRELQIHIENQRASTETALKERMRETDQALASLKELLAERDKAVQVAQDRVREAEGKGEAALDLRLEQMNQFRAQIERERGTYVAREFFDQITAINRKQMDDSNNRIIIIEQRSSANVAYSSKVDDLTNRVVTMEGKQGGVLSSIASLDSLAIRLTTIEARSEGTSRLVSTMFAGLGVLVAIASVLVLILRH